MSLAAQASPAFAVSHIGLCVADLERSQRFYTEGLGFQAAHRLAGGNDLAGAAEVSPPIEMWSQFLVKGDTRLELMAWPKPGVCGQPSTARNHLGFTHLSFAVEDLEAAVAHLVSLGATLVDGSQYEAASGMRLVFLADPDGTRLELTAAVDNAHAISPSRTTSGQCPRRPSRGEGADEADDCTRSPSCFGPAGSTWAPVPTARAFAGPLIPPYQRSGAGASRRRGRS